MRKRKSKEKVKKKKKKGKKKNKIKKEKRKRRKRKKAFQLAPMSSEALQIIVRCQIAQKNFGEALKISK